MRDRGTAYPKRLTVDVTQEYVDGNGTAARNCPIARATLDTLKARGYRVDHVAAYAGGTQVCERDAPHAGGAIAEYWTAGPTAFERMHNFMRLNDYPDGPRPQPIRLTLYLTSKEG
jgi:hypothetical protein